MLDQMDASVVDYVNQSQTIRVVIFGYIIIESFDSCADFEYYWLNTMYPSNGSHLFLNFIALIWIENVFVLHRNVDNDYSFTLSTVTVCGIYCGIQNSRKTKLNRSIRHRQRNRIQPKRCDHNIGYCIGIHLVPSSIHNPHYDCIIHYLLHLI